jgi:hypothetical protein
MSRLTGTDAYGLMEAYNNVYASQELTEEQVWEEVETWVNSLVEEGYDLSDYTWEEMYESYINEDLMGDLRANAGNIARGVSGAYQGAMRTASNVNQAVSDRMQRNIKPITTPKPPSRTFQSDSGGSTGFGRYGAPLSQVKTPKPAPAPAPRQQPAPAPRQQPAPARTATPPGGTTKPTATATPTPTPSASPARPSLSSQADEIRQMRARSLQRQGKTLDAATVSGTTRPAYQANSFDVFDVIKGHLIDEGYADTEEAALVIMSNMSEEWKESIMEAGRMHSSSDQQVGFARIRSGESGGRGKKPMDDEEIENQPGGTEFLERIKKTKKNPKYKK